MRILKIERHHLSEVAELERLCFSEPWSESALALLLTDAALGYVCEIDGRVVGYVGMMLAYDEGQITNVAVHPDARRQGVGRALMEAITQDSCARGLLQIALEVRESNFAAIALYEQLGFFELGKRPNFYRKPTEAAVIMEKKL